MRRATLSTLLTLAALLAPLAPSTVEAQCLPTSERDAFVAELAAAMRASDLTLPELYDHAANRLGYGWRGDDRSGRSVDALANAIADRLRGAAARPTGIDEALATMPDPGRGDLPAELQYPFRAADMTMAESLEETRRYQDAARGAQGTPNEREASRRRAISMNDHRAIGGVVTFNQAVRRPNLDVGTVLREFWFNHFNVSGRDVPWAIADYQRAIRRAQCSTFRELLLASGRHPAMLTYLNQRRSRAGQINENYARELLELHTFGDDRFLYYTQRDIVGVAEILTGWTVTGTTGATLDPRFLFRGSLHDRSAQDLFGAAPRGVRFTLPTGAAGALEERPEALIAYLAGHVATRRNICGKLAMRLLGARPAAVVNACAADDVWGEEGDLGAVYRSILTSEEMWSAARYGTRAKSPLELIVSARRAVDAPDVGTPAGIRLGLGFTASLGQPLGMVAPPTGYHDVPANWIGASSLVLWNQHVFEHIGTSRVDMVVGPSTARETLRGGALDRWVADRLARFTGAELTAERDRLTGRFLLELGLPRDAAMRLGHTRTALARPDVTKSGGLARPARSVIHAILTNSRFLRK